MKTVFISLILIASSSAFATSEQCQSLFSSLMSLSRTAGRLEGTASAEKSLQQVISFDLSKTIQDAEAGVLRVDESLATITPVFIQNCLK